MSGLARVTTGILLLVACGSRTGLPIDPPPDRDAPPVDAPVDAFVECRRDRDCNDELDCTRERCERNRCVRTTDDERCDDGRFCNGAERCELSRGCVEGTPPSCHDGVACTLDTCDPDLDVCVPVPDDGLCPVSFRCDARQGCLARALANWAGRIVEVDLPSGSSRVRASTGAVDLTDVALHPDGTLYGLTVDRLVEVTYATGATRTVVELRGPSVRFDGLDVGDDGLLYASGGSGLFRVNPRSGEVTRVATLPSGTVSAGDVAFFDGQLFVTVGERAGRTVPSSLARVDLDRGTSQLLGPTGFNCIWGLAPLGETLYGLSCEGAVVELDARTGMGTFLARPAGYEFWGASSR
ncbi:MAG: hypothetical protein H6720_21565 [Sandaracinus sp.]|nr:hypothetical protein [Sandaracinus sp.]MCB9625516.1 hypothetical protein [Sandaracinus sp.]